LHQNKTFSIVKHYLYVHIYNQWGYSVGVVIGYRLEDQRSGFRFPAETRNFSLLRCVQISSRAHPACYSMSTGCRAAGTWGWLLTSIDCQG